MFKKRATFRDPSIYNSSSGLLVSKIVQRILRYERKAFHHLFAFLQQTSRYAAVCSLPLRYEDGAWRMQNSRVPLKRTTSGVPVSFAFFFPFKWL